MGLGDWILCTGEAKAHHERTGQRVSFLSRRGKTQWSEIFEGNPRITRHPEKGGYVMIQGGGERPYILRKELTRWLWKPYKPIPGEIYFTDEERAWNRKAEGFVIVEPHVKNIGHSNKDYGWHKWVAFAQLWHRLSPIPLLQMGAPEARRLPHVRYVVTPTFRLAASVLSGAKAIVTTDGGLHHAAAAVGTPAVVIWSEFSSPDFLGYDNHINLRKAGPACGNRLDCHMCRLSMDAISEQDVFKALKRIV